MATSSFHFDSHRLRAAFAPRKPRHPLLRVAFGLAGLVLLVLLVFFSVFVGAAMIVAGLVYKLLVHRRKPVGVRGVAGAGSVMDGDYHVVRSPRLPQAR